MNKVIGGKRYSTETAKKVAEWENTDNRDDSHWYKEELFRKKNGEFFIHGQGGKESKYRRATGIDSWVGDEKIVPLKYDEAKKWGEEALDQDKFQSIFGDPAAGEPSVVTSFSLSKVVMLKLKRAAGDRQMTISQVIDGLVNKYL
jgi:hypothetical protein